MQMGRHHRGIPVRATATLRYLSIGFAADASEGCPTPLKFSAEPLIESALIKCGSRMSFFFTHTEFNPLR